MPVVAPSPDVPAGRAVLLDGPFNDRLRVHDLAFSAGERATASGSLEVVSDVSELLALEVEVAFLDAAGKEVAREREVLVSGAVHAHAEEPSGRDNAAGHDAPGHEEPGHDEPGHEEPEHDEELTRKFSVRTDAPGAVAAAVSVPVLVNE